MLEKILFSLYKYYYSPIPCENESGDCIYPGKLYVSYYEVYAKYALARWQNKSLHQHSGSKMSTEESKVCEI